jgi:hypothetical protein
MTDQPQDPGIQPTTGKDAEPGPPPGVPRWAKVSGIAVALFALILIAVMLISGGSHGPWRHMSGNHALGSHATGQFGHGLANG